MTDKTVVRTGFALVWIEMAGITTPFTTPVFPFLQTVSQRTLDNIAPAFVLAGGPSVEPIPQTPTAGLGQGVFAVDRELGSGYVQQWNTSLQRELTSNIAIEVAYPGRRLPMLVFPDTNLNQLSVDQLAEGATLLERVPNPYFGSIPAFVIARRPDHPARPAPEAVSGVHHGQPVPEQRRHDQLSRSLREARTTLLRWPVVLVSYTRSKLVDDASSVFDASILTGPVANFPVADSFNRRLERDYSTGDIPHVFVSSAVWDIPVGAGRRSHAAGVLGAIVNDWTLTGVLTLQSGVPVAIAQTTNNNMFAGFGTQRPNLIGDPTLPADERSVGRWFNTGAFAAAPQFAIGSSSRNPLRGPGYRNLDIALMRRVQLAAGRPGIAWGSVQCHEYSGISAHRRRGSDRQLRDDHDGGRSAVVQLDDGLALSLRDDHVGRRSAGRSTGPEFHL